MRTDHLAGRIIQYIIGLFFMAFAVPFSINSNLGISPVNSLPYVISLITSIRLGICVTTMFCLFILIQFLILRKDFQLISLTQILFSTIFGYFVDFTKWLLGDFMIPGGYLGRILMLVIGIFMIAGGMNFYLKADLVPLPTEGMIGAISQKTGCAFHRVKLINDVTIVSLSMLFSFLFLHHIAGVREGTVATACAVGGLMPFVGHLVQPLIRFLSKSESA
ncbi:YczE/YyaS/YitT family protein [Clostridium vitabionis]|uniref:YczE/YyaS/YitT family protein n=1 Tax=Clostridium vitabionis TaxID=2784388 RepID=UPI00188A62C3|nr:DUF6198 family protein [Clostridium vitabionis]